MTEASDDAVDDFAGLSRNRRLVLMSNLALVNFFASISFSILGPFFPQEAKQKNLSVTMTGVIVGEFEFVIFIFSPLVGAFSASTGTRFVYTAGLIICSVCSILFGVLEYCPPGLMFSVMCLATRGVAAIGTAMFVVSSFSIATRAFPSRLSTVFGLLETAGGVGFMVGPVIGGALYGLGGFKLPFIAIGSLLLVVAFLSLCSMPNLDSRYGDEEKNTGTTFALLKLPLTLAALFGMCTASSFLGFMDLSFQPFLKEKFGFTPVIVGLVLFLPAFVYALSAGLWGWLVDARGVGSAVMLGGLVVFSISMLFLYPAPFIPYSPNLAALFPSIVAMGLACAAVVVPVFNLVATESYSHGFERNLATYSLVSGLVNSAWSFGAFLGPTVGGVVLEKVGLAWVLTGYSGILLLSAVLLLLPICYSGGFHRRPTRGMSLLGDAENVQESYGTN